MARPTRSCPGPFPGRRYHRSVVRIFLPPMLAHGDLNPPLTEVCDVLAPILETNSRPQIRPPPKNADDRRRLARTGAVGRRRVRTRGNTPKRSVAPTGLTTTATSERDGDRVRADRHHPRRERAIHLSDSRAPRNSRRPPPAHSRKADSATPTDPTTAVTTTPDDSLIDSVVPAQSLTDHLASI